MQTLTLVAAFALFSAVQSTKTDLVTGRYTFVSQDNYVEYLAAIGVPEGFQHILASTTPDAIVAKFDKEVIIRYQSELWSLLVNLTLDEPVEADIIGAGKKLYIVTLDNGDTLISREVENPDNYIEGKFTEEGMVLTLNAAKGITATRVFKRV